MTSSLRAWSPALALALFALPVFFACSSDPAAIPDDGETPVDDPDASTSGRDGSVFDSAPPDNSELDILRFIPARAYTSFDGVHTFKVPISVHAGGEDLTVTATDPSAATITAVKRTGAAATGDSGAYYLIDVKQAGTITLTASSKGRTATGTVRISSYDPSQWTTGQARYTTGGTDGNPPCAQCHAGGGSAPDHSPTTIASATDVEVQQIMLTGEKPGHVAIVIPSCDSCTADGKKHRWGLSEDELKGLVVYLRSLDPRGFE